MKYIVPLLVTAALPGLTHALERAATQDAAQVGLNTLELKSESKIMTLETIVTTISERLTRFETCAADKKLYSPTSPTADANGCEAVGDIDTLKSSQMHYCWTTDSGAWYDPNPQVSCITPPVICPEGYRIVNCSTGVISNDLTQCLSRYRNVPRESCAEGENHTVTCGGETTETTNPPATYTSAQQNYGMDGGTAQTTYTRHINGRDAYYWETVNAVCAKVD